MAVLKVMHVVELAGAEVVAADAAGVGALTAVPGTSEGVTMQAE